MPALNPSEAPEHPLPFPPADLLEGAALFLDFDGTLVDLAEAPDEIAVEPALPSLLQRLQRRLDGRLAIVTGRALADLERHLRFDGIAASGSHGLELRLSDGRERTPSPPSALGEARRRIATFADGKSGLIVENKPAGVALHFRRAPLQEAEVCALMDELARTHDLSLQHGKMVVELRPAGADKGDALRALMNEPGFAGARPLFVGDDLTDEHAFEAAAEMGGAGILVGAERKTAARYRLSGVAAVADWLKAAAG